MSKLFLEIIEESFIQINMALMRPLLNEKGSFGLPALHIFAESSLKLRPAIKNLKTGYWKGWAIYLL